ncbi:MAG: hypothetical protein WAL09_25360, partial [Pseudolabrys sp.]
MSALGHKRTFCDAGAMSALPPSGQWMLSGFRSVCGTFWSSTGTMSHPKHLLSSCLQLFGWFADYYVWKDILVVHADR